MLQYASAMEVLQLIFACIGLGLALWGVWIAFDDAVDLADAPKGDLRRLVALRNMRERLAEVSAQGVLTFVGVVSVLLPPPPAVLPEVAAEIEQAFLVRLGLMVVTIILTVNSFMERRQRMAFMAHIAGAAHSSIVAPLKEVTVLVDGKEISRSVAPEVKEVTHHD